MRTFSLFVSNVIVLLDLSVRNMQICEILEELDLYEFYCQEENRSIHKFLSLCVPRKAIAKSSLHHLPCQPSTSSLTRNNTEANIRSTVDWTVSLGISTTQQGSHIVALPHTSFLQQQLSSFDIIQDNTPSFVLQLKYHEFHS